MGKEIFLKPMCLVKYLSLSFVVVVLFGKLVEGHERELDQNVFLLNVGRVNFGV